MTNRNDTWVLEWADDPQLQGLSQYCRPPQHAPPVIDVVPIEENEPDGLLGRQVNRDLPQVAV